MKSFQNSSLVWLFPLDCVLFKDSNFELWFSIDEICMPRLIYEKDVVLL